jgi:uncharacterized protein YukE
MPASDGFTVDPDQLRAAASTLASNADDALAQLGLLRAATGDASAAAGDPRAADAIRYFDDRWVRHLHGLADLLADVRAGLDLSAGAYEQADRDGAGAIQRARP